MDITFSHFNHLIKCIMESDSHYVQREIVPAWDGCVFACALQMDMIAIRQKASR
jgi:hypothetical protein